MHLRVAARINLTHSLLTANIEEKDLLIGTHTDSKRTVCCHFDTVDIATVPTQISDVDTSLTVPDFDILVNLASRQ